MRNHYAIIVEDLNIEGMKRFKTWTVRENESFKKNDTLQSPTHLPREPREVMILEMVQDGSTRPRRSMKYIINAESRDGAGNHVWSSSIDSSSMQIEHVRIIPSLDNATLFAWEKCGIILHDLGDSDRIERGTRGNGDNPRQED
ncbi:hypothetical protein GF325_13850 [Candidatus Bathyarchaeota archaeon]|nr:hypothetical protein [Candidatus Bathyarchaeota archaeon]